MAICIVAAMALAKAQKVTVSPGFYSLPQLAARLSSPDHRLICAKALGNRLLFVSIHDRSLSDAKSLIAETLGVTFTPSRDGEERIEPQAARQSEERRLARSLEEYYGSRVNDVTSASATLLPTVTQASIDANGDRLAAKQPTRAFEEAADMLHKLGDGDFNPIAYFAIAKGVDIGSLMDKDAIDVGTAKELEMVAGPAWVNQLSLRTFANRSIADLPISADQREGIIRTFMDESFGVVRLSFDPYCGTLDCRLSVSFRPDSNAGARGDTNLVPDIITIAYPGLADLANAQQSVEYKKRREESGSALSSDYAAKAIRTPAGSRAVSEFVRSWAAATQKDVIMEVSQGRDLSPSRFLSGRTISADLKDELQGVAAKYESEMARGDDQGLNLSVRETAEPMAKTILSEPTYTCRDVGGVLCIRDEFGFLDHLYRFPSSAIADLEANRLHSSALIPTLAAVKAYCLGVAPEEAAIVSRFNCAQVTPDIEADYPILRGAFASAALSQDLQEHMASGAPVEKPLSSIKDFEIVKFCRDLRAEVGLSRWISSDGPASSANYLYPSLADTLQGSTIRVHFEKGDKRTSLSFSLTHPHYLPIPRLTPEGTLSHEAAGEDLVVIISWPAVQICPDE